MKTKILIIFFLIATIKSGATIIFTSVSPNTYVGNITYYLDIDNNGNNDFEIVGSGSGVYVNILGNNAVESIGTDAVAKNSGAPLGTNTWNTSGFAGMDTYFDGQGSKYLALKIIVSGQTYYGWAHMDLPSNGSYFTIYSYAWDDVPNDLLHAGQLIGIEENQNSESSINIYPNPSNGQIQINYTDLKVKSFEIYNMQGALVKQIPNPKPQTPNEIDVSMLPKGIYLVKLQSENRVVYKKLVVQ